MKKHNIIMDKLAENPKIVLKIQKLFNNFCGRCKQMAMSNSNRPLSDYCSRCQKKTKKLLGDEIEF